DELCRELRDLAADGDMVICMGAGDITKWAAALAQGVCDARGKKDWPRRPCACVLRREREEMPAVAPMPSVRGRLTPNAPLAPLVWFKSGGSAEWLFEPKDEEDLVQFMSEHD